MSLHSLPFSLKAPGLTDFTPGSIRTCMTLHPAALDSSTASLCQQMGSSTLRPRSTSITYSTAIICTVLGCSRCSQEFATAAFRPLSFTFASHPGMPPARKLSIPPLLVEIPGPRLDPLCNTGPCSPLCCPIRYYPVPKLRHPKYLHFPIFIHDLDTMHTSLSIYTLRYAHISRAAPSLPLSYDRMTPSSSMRYLGTLASLDLHDHSDALDVRLIQGLLPQGS